jgi:Flp pilus assembly protein TadD
MFRTRRAPHMLLLVSLVAFGCQPPASLPSRSTGMPLLRGLGTVHHAVSTASPEAQKLFDQGLACFYAADYEVALRSFTSAAESDPRLAMAYWGQALALTGETSAAAAKTAYEALGRAQSLAATVPEKAYIAALARRFPSNANADWRKPAFDYSTAARDLAGRYPNDLDAACLYAHSFITLHGGRLYTTDGQPEPGTDELVAIVEWALARNPIHVGANHYYLLATVDSARPQRALAVARRLPTLAPAAGHLLHLPALVYLRLGEYGAALRADEMAVQADRASLAAHPREGYAATLYPRHLWTLARTAAMVGHSRPAADTAAGLAAQVLPLLGRHPEHEAYAAAPYLVAARQAAWGDVLRFPEPPESLHYARALWHFARGLARASLKDVGPALQEHDAFAAQVALAKEVTVDGRPAGPLLEIADHLLSGRILAARADNDGARRQFELAVTAQDALDDAAPHVFPWPAREALGAHLLRTGKPAAAEHVFREDLSKTPNNPRALFGLAESLQARGRQYEADQVRPQFQAAWSSADLKLRIEDF